MNDNERQWRVFSKNASGTSSGGIAMQKPLHHIQIKRAYDRPSRGDGLRILVDRLWPRGLRKDDAKLDAWRKDVAPSTELRQFYGHRPEHFVEFAKRYRAELRRADSKQAVEDLLALARRRRVTLVTATRELEHSGAAVLASHLEGVAAKHPTRSPRGGRKPRR